MHSLYRRVIPDWVPGRLPGSGLLLLFLLAGTQARAACQDGVLFEGGVSTNGTDFVSRVGADEAISVGGQLCPRAEHLGLNADLYVAFEIGETFYFIDSGDGLRIFDGNNLTPYRSDILLTDTIVLELFNGVVGDALARVNLYVAYRLGETFYLDSRPAAFSIDANPTLHALAEFPVRQSTTAASGGEIRIDFDRALDPSTVDNSSLSVFGRWSGVLTGQVSLRNNDQTLVFTPDRALSAGEWVTASVDGDGLRAADGSRLYRGHSWGYWIATASANLTFLEVAQVSTREQNSSTQIQTYGAYAGDLNEDGWSDFVVPNELSNDLRIFLNDGAGGYGDFTIVPIDGADKPSPNEGADLDGDGDIDFVVGSAWGNLVHVFHGDGNGNLVQQQNLVAGERVRGVCLLDFENDGDADILASVFVGNRVALFTNDGSGQFSDATTFDVANGEWSCASADMNGDGLTDAVIGTRLSEELVVLLSNGDGSFTESARIDAQGDPWMLAAGDVDRDGRADIAAVNTRARALAVYPGDGRGGLASPASYSMEEEGEGFPLAVDMGDLDGDGDLDIVTSDFATKLFLIFENDGAGGYTRLPNQLTTIGAASCAILHDRDNDGDLDITGIDEEEDLLLLFRN